ncbi:MAG: hypothetical protein AB7V50_04765 [Vampirovibrionia bacterium]
MDYIKLHNTKSCFQYNNNTESFMLQNSKNTLAPKDQFIKAKMPNSITRKLISFGNSLSNDPVIKEFYKIIAKIETVKASISLINWKETITSGSVKNSYKAKQLLLQRKDKLINSDELATVLLTLSENKYQSIMDKEDKELYKIWSEIVYPKEINNSALELSNEEVRLINNAQKKWEECKENNDFESYKETLNAVFKYKVSLAEADKKHQNIYDSLLDNYDIGLTTLELDKSFDKMKSSILPIVKDIETKKLQYPNKYKYEFLNRKIESKKLLPLITKILTDMGYKFDQGELGRTEHPITYIISSPNDVRISIRKMPELITVKEAVEVITDAVHECGHALIYQYADNHLNKTGLISPTKTVSEAQARLWEIMIAKSKPFWNNYFKQLQKIYPEELNTVKVDDFYKAINNTNISPVRLNADELTYNLHIILRYEIEKEILKDKDQISSKIDNLPLMWNKKSKKYLYTTPKNDKEGVLQDVHWSYAHIGYFPSYTIGNMVAAQLFDEIHKSIPEIDKEIEKGNLKPVLNWLTENVNKNGGRESYKDLLNRLTNKNLQPDIYIDYLKEKYSEIFNI